MHSKVTSVFSPTGEILEHIIVESPETGMCECELYTFTNDNIAKAICIKCKSKFKATERQLQGKRIFAFEKKISDQVVQQLECQIKNAKSIIG